MLADPKHVAGFWLNLDTKPRLLIAVRVGTHVPSVLHARPRARNEISVIDTELQAINKPEMLYFNQ